MNASIEAKQPGSTDNHESTIPATQIPQIAAAASNAIIAILITAPILIIVLWSVIGNEVLLICLAASTNRSDPNKSPIGITG